MITGLRIMILRMSIVGLLYAVQLLAQASAQGVAYTWVDSEGVTHFSDSPPTGGPQQTGVVSMNLPAGYTEADPAKDYYSITNQWKRLQEQQTDKDRLALEKEQLRIEWYRIRQQARKAEAEAEANEIAARTSPLIIVNDSYPIYRHYPLYGSYYHQDRYQPVNEHPQMIHQPRFGLGPKADQQDKTIPLDVVRPDPAMRPVKSYPLYLRAEDAGFPANHAPVNTNRN